MKGKPRKWDKCCALNENKALIFCLTDVTISVLILQASDLENERFGPRWRCKAKATRLAEANSDSKPATLDSEQSIFPWKGSNGLSLSYGAR